MITEHDEKKPSAAEATGYIAGVCCGITRSAMRGKHISAAIIVLAAAVLLVGGSYVRHSDTKLFLQSVGCIVGLIGLSGWFLSVREK